jgi:menaquinone-9 beta-reductase
MQRWWRWRDDDAYEMHWFASDMGAAGAASPLSTRLMRDVADDPKATLMFFGVLNHEVRSSQLFTSPRAFRAAARALLDRPDQLIVTLKEIASVGKQNARRARQRRVALQS